jgi:hypothetical protein
MFLPKLKGRRLLLHEDNQSAIGVLTHLTSKSLTMMYELRKLFLLIVTYDIKIKTQYIQSAAKVLADNLSRVTDNPSGSWPHASSDTSIVWGELLSRPLRLLRQHTGSRLRGQMAGRND